MIYKKNTRESQTFELECLLLHTLFKSRCISHAKKNSKDYMSKEKVQSAVMKIKK
jgi:hypothetical protein